LAARQAPRGEGEGVSSPSLDAPGTAAKLPRPVSKTENWLRKNWLRRKPMGSMRGGEGIEGIGSPKPDLRREAGPGVDREQHMP